MTLLLPAADRVVRVAVDAVLEGRARPGAGSDVSFATRSSRYRIIHGVLREASDASLVGARFVGWLFDGGREPTLSDRWDTDARAVLIDESKGQIVVTSLTRVHVANAVSAIPEVEERPPAQEGGAGFPSRAGTLHGLPIVDPEPSKGAPLAPHLGSRAEHAPGPAAGFPPAPAAPAAATPAPPHASSPMPKRTIPPAPPIPGRQATPIPPGRPATPLMPMGLPMPMRPPTPMRGVRPHPGNRTAPMVAVSPKGATPPASPGPPPAPPPRGPSTHLGLAPATRFPPPALQGPIVLTEPLMTPSGPVDLSSIEEISAQLSVTGEVSAAIAGPFLAARPEPVVVPPPAPSAITAAGQPPEGAIDEDDDSIDVALDLPMATAAGAAPPVAPPIAPLLAESGPGWASKSAPLPQFDLDDADMDLPTRTDPLPPAPPSEEDAVIPLIPRP